MGWRNITRSCNFMNYRDRTTLEPGKQGGKPCSAGCGRRARLVVNPSYLTHHLCFGNDRDRAQAHSLGTESREDMQVNPCVWTPLTRRELRAAPQGRSAKRSFARRPGRRQRRVARDVGANERWALTGPKHLQRSLGLTMFQSTQSNWRDTQIKCQIRLFYALD